MKKHCMGHRLVRRVKTNTENVLKLYVRLVSADAGAGD